MAELAVLRDVVIVLLGAVVVVVLVQRLRVPTIAGFILAGAIVGPMGLGFVREHREVEAMAEVGVALLLFSIGVELRFGRLFRLLAPVLVAGTLQVVLTVALTSLAAFRFGLPVNAAVFLGLIIAVSSTAIVLRGLEARGELDAPHGRLTLGILIFQDLGVVPMMLALPLLAGDHEQEGSTALVRALLTAVLVLAGVLVAAWLVVPRVLAAVARTRQRELFILTVVVVCLGTAWVASSAGVSLALGAFLAGVVVAGSEYRHQALADLIPLKGVLTSLFFVSVGMLFDPSVLWRDPAPVLGLVIAILVGKSLVVLAAGAIMRLPLRVCVLTAAALSQVGEFSFVLMRAASGTPLLTPAVSRIFLPAAIITMLVTPIALAVGPRLAAGAGRLGPLTRRLGIRPAEDVREGLPPPRDHVIVAGYGVAGRELARSLRECGVDYVVVDLNPANVHRASALGEPAYFGDVTSPEVLGHLGAARAREIVIVINDPGAAERALRAVRRVAPHSHVLVRSRYLADVEPLLAAGASEVVPAEIEATVEIAERVLGRHAVDPDRMRVQIERIRARRSEYVSAGDA